MTRIALAAFVVGALIGGIFIQPSPVARTAAIVDSCLRYMPGDLVSRCVDDMTARNERAAYERALKGYALK